MKKIALPFAVAFLLFSNCLLAQQNADSLKQNIFEKLSSADTNARATVKIHQDKRIEKLVVGKKAGGSTSDQKTISGFRVQVFSSNTQRTAKNEAFSKEKLIRTEFPDQAVYVNYTSPFWKVRVGDFKTQTQAQNFRNQLIEAFPTMRSEVYIVREQVLTSSSK